MATEAAPTPQIVVDDSGLKEAVAKLVANSRNARDAFDEIGSMLEASIRKNFEKEGRYNEVGESVWRGGNKKWPELRESTVRQRAKSGRSAHPILSVSGQLKNSISYQATNGGVTVGTNLAYAAAHQYGTDKAGRSKNVTIPARPFLLVQDEDIDDSMSIIAVHLTKGLSK